jgi:hypothetical protein
MTYLKPITSFDDKGVNMKRKLSIDRARAIAVVVVTMLAVPAASSKAAPIVAGQDIVHSVAIQMIDLFPGSPFNPGPDVLTVQVRADGFFVMDRQAQVGSVIDFSIPQALFQGVLPGPLPPLAFDLVAGGADLTPSTGQITNVTQNPADPGFASGAASSFASGDFLANTYFKLVVPGAGATIYSDPNMAAVFTASISSLPLAPGTVLAGAARINLYLQTGAGFDPARDPIIGQSYNRTVTAVPEPASVLSLMAGVACLVGFGWARRCLRGS